MLMSQKCCLAGALLSLVAAGFVFAQDKPETNQNPPAANQNQPANNSGTVAQTFRAKQVLGSKVAIQGNASAGVVDDIVLDEHGNVDYLIVANTDGQLVTVPWDAAVFNADKRVATVEI